jgi:ribonucleotide reductase alpha subunit
METTTTTSNQETLIQRHGNPIIMPKRRGNLTGGLTIQRTFSQENAHPYDTVQWAHHDLTLGKFEHKGIEVPAHWGPKAIRFTIEKYLFGNPGTPEYETSLKHPFDRIANTYTLWGWEEGYFVSKTDALIFNEEIKAMLVQQIWAPNSPVWFNIGHWEQWRWGRPDLRAKFKGNKAWHAKKDANGNVKAIEALHNMANPQASACFLTSVADSMESTQEKDGILQHYVTEGRIFASGSGIGLNISALRSSYEPISGHGMSSGPIPFDRGWDTFAGGIKSGGKTRRAARMVIMNADHPDIFKFLDVKKNQEDIARLVIQDHNMELELREIAREKARTGTQIEKIVAATLLAQPKTNNTTYTSKMDGLLYGETLSDQNANHTVSLNDEFWQAQKNNDTCPTRWVTNPSHIQDTYKPDDLLQKIALSIRACGEPGIHNHDWINLWNPVKTDGEITTSNPCCYTGDTLVAVADARKTASFKQLAENKKDTLVYCINTKTKEMQTRRMHTIEIKRKNAPVVKLTLTDGSSVRMTPDELVMLETGEYQTAQTLTPGQHLYPFPADGRNPATAVVKSVTPDGNEDVYDGTVDEHHNFAVIPKITTGPQTVRYSWTVRMSTEPETSENPARTGFFTHNSEYLHLTDTSCNLSSVNIIRFLNPDGTFNADKLAHSVRLAMIVADLNIERGGFPNPAIAIGTYRYRTTGIGMTNLGGTLMTLGIPYDSDNGRFIAAALCDLITATAWQTSGELGTELGAYDAFPSTGKDLREVINLHNLCHTLLPHVGNPETFRETMKNMAVENPEHPTPKTQNLNAKDALLALNRNFNGKPDAKTETITKAVHLLANKHWEKTTSHKTFRNSFVTCLAPTGTISAPLGNFDSGTTSAEPEFSLVKYKELAGGGTVKLVNNLAFAALKTLGYPEDQTNEAILEIAGLEALLQTGNPSLPNPAANPGPVRKAFDLLQTRHPAGNFLKNVKNDPSPEAKLLLNGSGHLEHIPWLKPEHLPVFDCAVPANDGKRSISLNGHIAMLGAIQPFISGATSKTVNMPGSSTPEQIKQNIILTHDRGVKCAAFFPDGAKAAAVLSTPGSQTPAKTIWDNIVDVTRKNLTEVITNAAKPKQHKLQNERDSKTVKFSINSGQLKGYLTFSTYPDGTCGELFGRLGQVGSFASSMFEGLCKQVSISLQFGMPLQEIIDTFQHMAFDPSGFCTVGNIPDLHTCSSIFDLLAKALSYYFPKETEYKLRGTQDSTPPPSQIQEDTPKPKPETPQKPSQINYSASQICPNCGKFAYLPDGKCRRCQECGFGGGCGA